MKTKKPTRAEQLRQLKIVKERFSEELRRYDHEIETGRTNPYVSDHALIALTAKREVTLLACGRIQEALLGIYQ